VRYAFIERQLTALPVGSPAPNCNPPKPILHNQSWGTFFGGKIKRSLVRNIELRFLSTALN
jgi:hypothetical protein